MAVSAFVGWNSFQLRHFMPVLAEMREAVMLVEARPRHVDALGDAVEECPVPTVFWPKGRLHELDGIFDVLVCQTRFEGLERFRRTPVAMLMYGLAKETYNYGEWRSLAQLHLVYGERSRAKMQQYGEVAVVGNPRFDRWHDGGFHARARRRFEGLLDPHRRTVLYAPTWGELSTAERYFDEVVALTRDYNVLFKAHHNTELLGGARAMRKVADRMHAFGADDDLYELLAVSDVVLSDYSGAIFDALCAERPVILLHDPQPPFGAKLNADSIEHAARHEIGPVVSRPSQLGPTLRTLFDDPAAYRARNDALRRALFERTPGASRRAAAAITSFAEQRRRSSEGAAEPEPSHSTAATRRATILSRLSPLAQKAASSAVLRRLHASNPLQMRIAQELSRRAGSPLPQLLAARAALAEQKPLAAYRLLVDAQRHWPAHRGVLMMLTQIHREDGDTARARATLRLEEHLAPVHGAVRRLSLETSMGDMARAEAVFDRLQPKLAGGMLRQHLPAVGRAAAPLGTRDEQLRSLRRRLAGDLEAELAQGHDPRPLLRHALAARAMPLARHAADALDRHPGRGRSEREAYRRAREGLGELLTWAELAWHNECESSLHAVVSGRVVEVSSNEERSVEGLPLVDFFLPTPFFDYTNTKPTHATVRRAFRTLGAALGRRDDVVVVPRLQFNWRSAPVDPARPAISYHTHDPSRSDRMHVQEAELHGRVSLDRIGYAGFSSLAVATHPSRVDEFAATRTDEERQESFERVRETVVGARLSKYPQRRAGGGVSGPYTFLAMQVVTDPVSRLSWVRSDVLAQMVAKAVRDAGKRLVIKRHPYCRSLNVARTLKALSEANAAIISDASIHDLIPNASAVVTVNSGVGLEALAYGKPVIVTGESVYSYAAHRASDADSLRELLRDTPPQDHTRTPRFFDYYLNRHTFEADDRVGLERALDGWLSSVREAPGTQSVASARRRQE